jgi:hypothetical protein
VELPICKVDEGAQVERFTAALGPKQEMRDAVEEALTTREGASQRVATIAMGDQIVTEGTFEFNNIEDDATLHIRERRDRIPIEMDWGHTTDQDCDAAVQQPDGCEKHRVWTSVAQTLGLRETDIASVTMSDGEGQNQGSSRRVERDTKWTETTLTRPSRP